MVKAIWNGAVVAESGHTLVVEGNHYFPREAVDQQLLRPSDHHTECPWKGTASYFDLQMNGEVNENAAWSYPNPKPEAEMIRDRIAFWKGVEVTD
jgi:uncharacterized protein (DUF427 family)